MAKHTKLELVCELCGTQLIKLEIHKGMLACDFCLSAHKRRELMRKRDEEWERGYPLKNVKRTLIFEKCFLG